MSASPSRRMRDLFGDHLERRRDSLSPRLLEVANYIDRNRHAVLGMSALEIGFETETSDATVIRAIQALGFAGLRELKATLETWLGQTDSPVEKMAMTTTALHEDIDAAIDFVLHSQRTTVEALSTPENRAAMAEAVNILAAASGVCVFGIGASGIIAEYSARLFTRSGLPGTALSATGIALAEQMLAMRSGQALIMMLHGRAHREATTIIGEAKRLGMPIVIILGQQDSPLRAQAQCSILLPRAKADQVSLHAPTLVAVEALHIAVSARIAPKALRTLDRLLALRRDIRPYSR